MNSFQFTSSQSNLGVCEKLSKWFFYIQVVHIRQLNAKWVDKFIAFAVDGSWRTDFSQKTYKTNFPGICGTLLTIFWPPTDSVTV